MLHYVRQAEPPDLDAGHVPLATQESLKQATKASYQRNQVNVEDLPSVLRWVWLNICVAHLFHLSATMLQGGSLNT